MPDPAPARDRAPSAIAPGPAASSFPALPLPAEGGPFVARPAPTRTAVLAAFEQAMQRPAAIASPAGAAAGAQVARGTPAALAAVAPAPVPAPAPPPAPLMLPAPLSRVTVGAPVQSMDGDDRQAARGPEAAAPAGPDLEALADYVLERLRYELRDGRERLGYLLDDAR